jgi:hypothetical protein
MPMYRATIVIYSEFDPGSVELSVLAREAEEGAAYCNSFKVDQVVSDALPASVAEFFYPAEDL